MDRCQDQSPSWSRLGEIPAVVLYRANLIRTVAVTVVVGTILFLINQLDVVLAGRATGITWLRVALTYLVPFCVSNYGILVASHRPKAGAGSGSPGGTG